MLGYYFWFGMIDNLAAIFFLSYVNTYYVLVGIKMSDNVYFLSNFELLMILSVIIYVYGGNSLLVILY